MNCTGSLILHRDGAVAGCTNDDDDQEGCAGREARHEGDPTTCVVWFGGYNYCGIHSHARSAGDPYRANYYVGSTCLERDLPVHSFEIGA